MADEASNDTTSSGAPVRGSSTDPNGSAWDNLVSSVKGYLGIGSGKEAKINPVNVPGGPKTPQEIADEESQ